MEDLTKDPKWVARALNYFDIADMNKDGVLTLDEVSQWADQVKEACKPSDEEIKELKTRLREVYGAVGVTEEGVKREDWPNCLNQFAKDERERKQNKQETFHGKLCNAFFDVIDMNKDGTICLEELKVRMRAFGMSEEAAKPFFEFADTNKNGKLEREEVIDIEFKFWFEPLDEKYDALYGGYY